MRLSSCDSHQYDDVGDTTVAQRTRRAKLLDLADLGRETTQVAADCNISQSTIPDAIGRDVSGYALEYASGWLCPAVRRGDFPHPARSEPPAACCCIWLRRTLMQWE